MGEKEKERWLSTGPGSRGGERSWLRRSSSVVVVVVVVVASQGGHFGKAWRSGGVNRHFGETSDCPRTALTPTRRDTTTRLDSTLRHVQNCPSLETQPIHLHSDPSSMDLPPLSPDQLSAVLNAARSPAELHEKLSAYETQACLLSISDGDHSDLISLFYSTFFFSHLLNDEM